MGGGLLGVRLTGAGLAIDAMPTPFKHPGRLTLQAHHALWRRWRGWRGGRGLRGSAVYIKACKRCRLLRPVIEPVVVVQLLASFEVALRDEPQREAILVRVEQQHVNVVQELAEGVVLMLASIGYELRAIDEIVDEVSHAVTADVWITSDADVQKLQIFVHTRKV